MEVTFFVIGPPVGQTGLVSCEFRIEKGPLEYRGKAAMYLLPWPKFNSYVLDEDGPKPERTVRDQIKKLLLAEMAKEHFMALHWYKWFPPVIIESIRKVHTVDALPGETFDVTVRVSGRLYSFYADIVPADLMAIAGWDCSQILPEVTMGEVLPKSTAPGKLLAWRIRRALAQEYQAMRHA